MGWPTSEQIAVHGPVVEGVPYPPADSRAKADPQAVTVVKAQIDTLSDELGRLDKALAELSERLAPVLTPPFDAVRSDTGGTEPVVSQLTRSLVFLTRRAESLREVVEDLTARCEV